MTNLFQNNVVSTFPDITKIDFIKINKKYLKVILLNISLYFLLLLIGLILWDIYFLNEQIPNQKIYIYLCLILVFLFLYTVFIIGFSKRKYAVREKDISYKSGILFKKTTTVPYNRVQHIEIDQGPFSRIFKLAAISVYTAGDSSDDLKISGILKEDAIQIKEFISNKIDG
ncbi:PH domain-containing protein [uncultured Polaribacter sp.]|uniref:PH domain-containing protein n=1 Tax=uncultured Polaribacter sp. TaxID=174711 RepID=UPI00261C85A9|nr:PH domain-containing protein [uncultured Polaribacter sp.]